MKRNTITWLMLLGCIAIWAQGVKPLPTLHVEGRWLVDKHGNQVVLHGVMDTPSNYFNPAMLNILLQVKTLAMPYMIMTAGMDALTRT